MLMRGGGAAPARAAPIEDKTGSRLAGRSNPTSRAGPPPRAAPAAATSQRRPAVWAWRDWPRRSPSGRRRPRTRPHPPPRIPLQRDPKPAVPVVPLDAPSRRGWRLIPLFLTHCRSVTEYHVRSRVIVQAQGIWGGQGIGGGIMRGLKKSSIGLGPYLSGPFLYLYAGPHRLFQFGEPRNARCRRGRLQMGNEYVYPFSHP